MDKYEYKIRSDEIKSLIEEKAYAQAAEIADTIDWRRVKSVRMLCTISDLYKVNRRFEDAKNMLLLAYDKRPGGKSICYSLCEICIKTGEFVQALKYCDEFIKAAPKDSGRYILKYKLYEAQDVSLEERISVLEELKKRDYREKWAYELAYLYHRVGLATRCVEECDELILWFGDGKYVVKAMELKMLHQPLTPSQQAVYDRRFDTYEEAVPAEENGEADIYGDQTVYDESGNYYPQEAYPYETYEEEGQYYGGEQDEGFEQEDLGETEIQVKTMDVGKYNTINLQEELAAGLQEVLGGEEAETPRESDGAFYGDASAEEGQEDWRETEETEVFFGETGEMERLETADTENQIPEAEQFTEKDLPEEIGTVNTREGGNRADGEEKNEVSPNDSAEAAAALSQEADGQMSLVLPGEAAVEKQITGQMNIEDILEEWERTKKESEEKRKEEVRERVLRQTGPMFTEFEAAVRDDLLEQLEGGQGGTADVREERRGGGAGRKDSQADAPGEEKAAESGTGYLETAERQGTVSADGAVYESEGPNSAADSDEAVMAYSEKDGSQAWISGETSAFREDAEIPEEGQYGETASGWDSMEEGHETAGWEYAESTGYEESAEGLPVEDVYEDPETYAEDPEGAGWEYAEGTGYEESAEGLPVEDVYEDPETYAEDPEGAGWEYAESAGYEEGAEGLSVEDVYEDPETYAEDPEGAGWEYAESTGYEEYAGGLSAEEAYEDPETYAEGPEGADWDYAAGSGYEEDAAEEEETGEEQERYIEEDGPVDWDFTEESDSQETPSETEETPGDPVTDRELAEEWDEQSVSSEALDYMEALEQLEDLEDAEEAAAAVKTEEGTERTRPGKEETAGEGTEAAKGSGKTALEHDRARVRSLSREEKELFAPFIQSRQSREQLVKALDGISMAAYTGNVIITGEEGMDTLTLARNMIREVSMTDRNFSGRVAKISGQGLNQKDVRETLDQLHNGALIIQKASGMNTRTAGMLHSALQQEKFGIIVILEDTKKAIQKLFLGTPELFGDFTARMDLEALSNDVLVSFGRRYAREKEYSIDDLGVLALHTRIEECQTIDHVVTVIEVKQIVDEAIRHASRKTLGHFLDILLARRYDDEDMIILTEKDFVA